MKLFIEKKCFHEETLYPLVWDFHDDDSVVYTNARSFGLELIDNLPVKHNKYRFLDVFWTLLTKPVNTVFFNTFEDFEFCFFVLLAYFRKIEINVLAHNLGFFFDCGNINKSKRERLFSPIFKRFITPLLKNIYVLDKRMIDVVSSSAYAWKLQEYATTSLSKHNLFPIKDLKLDEFNYVCLIGDISYKKRNYDFLFSINGAELQRKKIKFVFCGNVSICDGNNLVLKLKEKGLLDYCVFFDRYLSYAELFYVLSNSCFSVVLKKDWYGFNKTSATEHISKAFGIPCLEPSACISLLNMVEIDYAQMNQKFAYQIASAVQNAANSLQ
ncbi:TPA: hypothetical protein ACF3DY_005240 [Klebsiella quasipneumoniae subsp. similipneumoniae]